MAGGGRTKGHSHPAALAACADDEAVGAVECNETVECLCDPPRDVFDN